MATPTIPKGPMPPEIAALLTKLFPAQASPGVAPEASSEASQQPVAAPTAAAPPSQAPPLGASAEAPPVGAPAGAPPRESDLREALTAGLPNVGSAKSSRQGFRQASDLEEASATARYQAGQSLQAADSAQQAAETDVAGVHYNEVDKALQQRKADRVAAIEKARIQMEAAEAKADDLAKAQPNPSRLWNNMGTWQKASAIVSTMAFAFANSRQPGLANPMITTLKEMIGADMADQRTSIARAQERQAQKIEGIKFTRSSELAEADDEYTMTSTRVEALDRYLNAMAKGAGADQKRLAGIQMARSELAKIRGDVALKHTESLVQKEEMGARFAHDERMAKLQIDASERAASAKAAAEKGKGMWQMSPQLNLTVVGGVGQDGKPIEGPNPNRALDEKVFEKATTTATQANALHEALNRMAKKLRDADNIDVLIKTDAEYNQDAALAARYLATQKTFNQGPTSDKDVDQARNLLTGRQSGGLMEQVATLTQRRDMAEKAIQNYLGNMPELVNQSLQAYPTPDGGSLRWTPPEAAPELLDDKKYLVPGEQEARARDSVAADSKLPVGTPATRLLPMTQEDLAVAQSVEAKAKGATARGALELAKAKFSSKDALRRFALGNEKELDAARSRELEVASELALRSVNAGGGRFQKDVKVAPIDVSDMRKEMVKAGFSASKLTKEDYTHLQELVDENVRKLLNAR